MDKGVLDQIDGFLMAWLADVVILKSGVKFRGMDVGRVGSFIAQAGRQRCVLERAG